MPSHIVVNGLGLTYKGTIGLSIATIPDVCKTPSPGGPIPLPYPNIANQGTLKDGTTTVVAKGGKMIAIKGSQYGMSSGDEPGTVGGVKSNVFKKATDWITYSFDVKMDGKNACRHTDKKFHNDKNTVDLAGNVDPMFAVGNAGLKPLKIQCKNAPKGKKKYTTCEKEEICAKCKAINDECVRTRNNIFKRTTTGVRRRTEKQRSTARADSLSVIAKLRDDIKAGNADPVAHDGLSPKCKKELMAKINNDLEGVDIDHAVDLQIGGCPVSSANLRVMSNGPNRFMGSKLRKMKGTHTGVKPDCCAGGK
ncbi:DUF4150 domain-containing protein [Mesorhizobium sp. M1050]|uniref:DUF4150 domain-containing protein n=1 Tax=Mesorhizobium sp. M1050 TaxID=2957051 RepID=UPI00333B2FDA